MKETEYRERTFESYVPPEEIVDIRKKYVANASKESREGWPQTKVEIVRNNPDGTTETVFEYHRNYSFRDTFEPFLHFANGQWYELALISTLYYRFEVLDLQKGEIIAVEPYPTVTEEHHNRWKRMGRPEWCDDEPIGTEKPGWGFCPTGFYVPNVHEMMLEWFDEDSPVTSGEIKKRFNSGFAANDSWHYYISERSLAERTGQYAFYSGCIWGDDTSMKLRWIDLSRVTEGVVVSDEDRYGYVPLAFTKRGQKLRDLVQVSDNGFLTVSAQLNGHIDSPGFHEVGIRWREESDN